MNIRNAILSTASLFEVRPAALDFTQYRVPKLPDETGCPLGWIGYYLGMIGKAHLVARTFVPEDDVIDNAQWRFFGRMNEISDSMSWIRDSALCAKSLRYYADMYHGEDVREAA